MLKLFHLLFTLLYNGLYSFKIGKVSDNYRVNATPSKSTFRIWGVIYVRLFLFSLLEPFTDCNFEQSMKLNRMWLKAFTDHKLVESKNILNETVNTNARLTKQYAHKNRFIVDTLDIYSTWVFLASLLNEWIVKVHVQGEDDNSLAYVQEAIKSLEVSRPGVRYTVDIYLNGIRRHI